MKIDEMLKREDFFEILQVTLNSHYEDQTFRIKKGRGENGICVLYVYDKLNAIVSKNPTYQVKEFLKTEYAVTGSYIRKFAVKLYLNLLLQTKGLFSNTLKVYLSGTHIIDLNNLLIYPCNKKIRVFDFDKQFVDVITKSGFPSTAIKKEISFRIKYINPHIEPIVNYGDDWYTERIIDGKPLARIRHNKEDYNTFKRKSLEILNSISKSYKKAVNSNDYKREVISEIKRISELFQQQISISKSFEELLEILNEKLSGFNQEINVTLSHGDFHHGNIWIENLDRKIKLIDWETADIRFEWYDLYTLYGGLREIDGIKNLLANLLNNPVIDIAEITGENDIKNTVLLVLLEDLKFRIVDLASTPFNIGIPEFENYCHILLLQLKTHF